MNNLAIHGTNSLVESLNMNVSNHVLGLNNSQLASSTSTSLLSNSSVSPVSSYSTSMIGNNLNNSLANLNTLSANDESKTNLIINYLPQAMTQEDLRNLFSSIGELESCKLIRDKLTGQSLGYGFVNYVKCSDAEKAINSLNALRMQQKTIKVSFARPSTPLIKDANLYVSGLSKSMTQEDLQRIFHPYGRIITSRILVDPSTGMSRGVGFVRYDKRPEAENAISALNGTVPPGAKDPITVKFANNPSQKNQQVLQSLYAATSPTRRLATSTGGPLYHQTRSFRTGVNDLLSNVNMGLGAKRTTPYPEVHGAQIITAGGLQATAPALQLAPSGAEYLQPASYLPAGLTSVDQLSTLQALGPYPTAYQIPFQTTQLPRVGVLPSITPGTSSNYGMLPIAQLPQAGAGANLRVLQSHAFTIPTATPGAISAITPQMAGTSAPSGTVTTGVTSAVATESNSHAGEGVKSDEVVAATTTPSTPQWYSPLAPDLLTSMGVNSTGTNQSSSSVIGQSANFGICIFVYNLAPETDESILWQLFGPFGAVTSVKVIRDFQTQKCKGYGFVTMTNYEEAFMAVCSLNGYKLGDRVLQVRFDVIS